MSNPIAYQASATGGFTTTAETPRKAAEQFFTKFPNKRKCNITRGEVDGIFFVSRFISAHIRSQFPNTPVTRWPEITKKTIDTLPTDEQARTQDVQG